MQQKVAPMYLWVIVAKQQSTQETVLLVAQVMSTPTFENEMCLKCKNLAICGGLCFNRRMNYLLTGKLSCVKSKLDTGGVSEYLKEYYKIRLEKRRKLNME